MDPYNNVGAPYDPKPEDALPDNQETLNDDYAENAANDVPENMLDNPEDIPADEEDQLKEGILDTMPGDTEDAVRRDLESPNEPKNRENDQRYYDSDRNPDLDAAISHQSVADKAAEREMEGDISEEDPEVERRIG